MRGRSYIYGLFNGNRCRYIGQTVHPSSRLGLHRTPNGKGKIATHGEMEMRVLRQCRERDAGRIERQIVAAYKSRGQCELNIANRFTGGQLNGNAVYWVEGNAVFKSFCDAATYFHCSDGTISNWCKHRNGYSLHFRKDVTLCYLVHCCPLKTPKTL